MELWHESTSCGGSRHPRVGLTSPLKRNTKKRVQWPSGGRFLIEWRENGKAASRLRRRDPGRSVNLPRVKFWLPTREYQTVEAYRRMGGTIPPNLCIRYSAHLVGAAPPLHYGLPVSTVSSHQDNTTLPGTHRCPAALQGNTAAAAVPVGTRES